MSLTTKTKKRAVRSSSKSKTRAKQSNIPPLKSKVKKVMHEFKEGVLFSGGSGKKVTNPKQAIAIALSEGRKARKRK